MGFQSFNSSAIQRIVLRNMYKNMYYWIKYVKDRIDNEILWAFAYKNAYI